MVMSLIKTTVSFWNTHLQSHPFHPKKTLFYIISN